VGKHCGFVQFVRKVDAEKAIEKMQGFPIGGSRIRLSWGRSQCKLVNLFFLMTRRLRLDVDKAAQAAAQAAQAAALENQYASPVAPAPGAITQEQALHLLQKFSLQNYPSGYDSSEIENALLNNGYSGLNGEQKTKKEEISSGMSSFQPRSETHRPPSSFSPFSPDPNNLYTSSERVRRDSGNSFSRLESLPHPSKAFAPGFYPLPSHELKLNTTLGPSSGQTSEIQEAGLMRDLNGTLSCLELDRSWKSPGAALPRISSY
jgi:RNA recognition motif-containing protein